MTPRTFMPLLATLAALVLAATPAAAFNATWKLSDASWDGIWEDAGHWTTTNYPDKTLYTGDWNCTFNASSISFFCELSNSHKVTTITTLGPYSPISLVNRTGSLVWLQFTSLTNSCRLEIEGLDLYGDIANTGTVSVYGGLVTWYGDYVQQYPDGGLAVHSNLRVDGTVTNGGHVDVYAGATLTANTLVNDENVNLLGGAVHVRGPFTNPVNSVVRGAGTFTTDGNLTSAGSISAETGSLALICDGTLTSTGLLRNLANAALFIEADTVDQGGTISVASGGGVTFTTGLLVNKTGATITLAGGTLGAPSLTHKAGAAFTGFGTIAADLTNEGLIDLYGPSQVVGNVTNKVGATLKIRNADLLITKATLNYGTIQAVNGKVYFEGGLTNHGTVHMDPSMAVFVGDVTIGAEGVLVGDAGSTFQFMGNLDNRSTAAATFDVRPATVEFLGRDAAAAPQTLEVAGKNLGVVAAGWTSNFAAGTLRIGRPAVPTRVRLVDAVDNQPAWDGAEALYVSDLEVAPDCTLQTAGLPVYVDGTLTNLGTLDLADGNLIVDYSGASPLVQVADWVRSGFTDGPTGWWDGPGIQSAAAANNPTYATALGVLDNRHEFLGGLEQFKGVPIDADCVLVTYAWWGDIDFDGQVTLTDYSVFLYYFFEQASMTPDEMGWWSADLDYDGSVTLTDYNLLLHGFLTQTGPLGGGGVPAPVPEPATLALVSLAGLGMALARRR